MHPEPPFRTSNQVVQYLREPFGPEAQFSLLETEFGWVCRPILTQQEIAAGMGLGLGNYVVNKQTGVITEHRSLPPELIGQEYDQAIRSGQPVQGARVYPPTWNVQIQATRETPTDIEYRVQARSLTNPPAEPPIDHLLLIDKQTFHMVTNVQVIHPACSEAAAWAEDQSQETGTWPQAGTFQF